MIDSFTGWLSQFWVAMLVHLWQTTLFIGVLWLAARALRRAAARTRSALYWVGVLKLLLPLPVLGVLTSSLLGSLTGPATAAPAGPGWTVTVLMVPAMLEPQTAGWAGLSPIFWVSLTAIWLLGSVACLSRRMRARLSRPRLDARHGVTSTKLHAALADADLSSDAVRVDRSGVAPFVTGNRRPFIVFPHEALEECSQDDLCAVLIHEREHVRRRDPLRYTLLSAIHAVFWFYPPLRWLERGIHETTEMACDEAVLHAGFTATAYARTLARMLSLGLSRRHGIGAMGRDPDSVRVRITRILTVGRPETMRSHRVTVIAAAFAAVVLSFLPFAPGASLRAGDETAAGNGLDQLAEADLPVMLNFTQVQAGKIFEAIGAASGITFVVSDEVAEKPISINLGKISLKSALTEIAKAAGTSYKVVHPWEIEVHPILLAGVDGVTLPTLIPDSKVKPAYPEEAREERIQGQVILQAMVDSTGAVQDLKVLNVKPADNDAFAKSAVEAVSQWRYEPATRDGEPVDIYFTIRVDFKLE